MNKQSLNILSRRAKGSTLIEAIVSLVIIMVVFSIAMSVIININKYTIGFSKNKAEKEIATIYKLTQENKKFIDETIKVDNLIFEKTVTTYRNYANLFQVKIIVYDINYKEMLTEYRIMKYE